MVANFFVRARGAAKAGAARGTPGPGGDRGPPGRTTVSVSHARRGTTVTRDVTTLNGHRTSRASTPSHFHIIADPRSM